MAAAPSMSDSLRDSWRPHPTSLASCSSFTAAPIEDYDCCDPWFTTTEYGSIPQQQHAPVSVLSSLYGVEGSGSMSLYDDLMISKDFEDEEMAEIDMESFCREDMHNLLLNRGRRPSNLLVTSSIYRSEMLFSPVHDSVHLSLDSLDMSGYPNEEDIILTCKANKDNYTIAFEGSIICSEAGSFYGGADGGALEQRKRELLDDLARRRKAAIKMSTSVDCNLTTWSKLKKTHNSHNLNRFLVDGGQLPPLRRMQCWEEKRATTMGSSFASSGITSVHLYSTGPAALRKTKSLSDLSNRLAMPTTTAAQPSDAVVPNRGKLNVSQVILDNMGSVGSASPNYEQCKLRSLLPNCAIPIHHSQQQLLSHQQQQHQSSNQQSLDEEGSQIGGGGARRLQASGNDDDDNNTSTTSNNNPASEPNSGAGCGDRPPSFNLVKLFIKQKSSSTDTCMDVSSGCWPSADSSSQSLEQQQIINANIHNRNYFKRRIDGSASNLTRHEEENDVDSLDPLLNNKAAVAAAVPDQNQNGNQKENHHVLENNNNLINNLINNNHLSEDAATTTTAAAANTLSDSRNSSEDHTNITQIYNLRNNNNHSHTPKNSNLRRLHMETVTRSMQTSIPKLITSATQYATTKAAVAVATGRGAPVHNRSTATAVHQRVKIVPASFLKQLHKNERRGDSGMAPVYVIYPNYTLPNLDFVTKHEVILSPIDYKETFMGMNGVRRREKGKGAISKMSGTEEEEEIAKEGSRLSLASSNGRPKSFNDILSGGGKKAKFDYKNIYDWKSLIILLPMEYSRILRSIPDIDQELEGLKDVALDHEEENDDGGFGEDVDDDATDLASSQSQKQLFCQTTPILRRKLARPLSCDCAAYILQTSSSSSSSNQPASSGYRGSSTILTDSELGLGYDVNDVSDDTIGLPPTHCGRTPKGILRRNFNRTRMRMQSGKRNSMFDGTEQRTEDKRRSLQEFPTQQYFDNMQTAEDYLEAAAPLAMNPLLLNYKQQMGGNDLSGLSRFRKKLSNELEALEMELLGEQENISSNVAAAMPLGGLEGMREPYDRLKLRNDVSRALCNQPKRVSFTESNGEEVGGGAKTSGGNNLNMLAVPNSKAFITPPNSPNISVMAAAQKRRPLSEQERIQSNRFKRLQIQWELLSKDSQSLMKEMNENIPMAMETQSGGSTPTGPQRISRIPRPISYPASRIPIQEPSRMGTRTAGRTPATPKKSGQPHSAPLTPRVQNKSAAAAASKKPTVTPNRFAPKTR